MVFDIKIGNYKLQLLDSVEVHKSVDLLTDTATITLPGTAYNQALKIEDKIKRGDRVVVKLGYDEVAEKPEFDGWLQAISTDGGNITLTCEDDIFHTRVALDNKVFQNVNVKALAEYIVQSTGLKDVVCDYDFRYDKFIIESATGFDVLKKIQEETGANIYMKDDVLHIHAPYIEIFGRVKYDFARNIESADLEYKNAEDRKYQVEVEGIGTDGKRITTVVGTMGGDKRSIKIYGVTEISELKKRGEAELKYLVYTGYEGNIQGWLIPYVEPGYSAHLRDTDYEYKDGWYYVNAVTTTFSKSGGVRKVELGYKLSANGESSTTS